MMTRTPWLFAAAALALLPLSAQADPAQRVCDHLAEHAEDYDEQDDAECLEGMQELLASLPEAKRVGLADCVTAQVPIGKEGFMECMVAAVNPEDPLTTPPSDPTIADDAAVSARISQVCQHLTANAVDFSEEDAQACPETFAMLREVLGPEPFSDVTDCLLQTPQPSQADLEACVQAHAEELQ